MKWLQKVRDLPVPLSVAQLCEAEGKLTLELNENLADNLDKMAKDIVLLQAQLVPVAVESNYDSGWSGISPSGVFLQPDDVEAGEGIEVSCPDNDGPGKLVVSLGKEFLHDHDSMILTVKQLHNDVLTLKLQAQSFMTVVSAPSSVQSLAVSGTNLPHNQQDKLDVKQALSVLKQAGFKLLDSFGPNSVGIYPKPGDGCHLINTWNSL